MAIAGRAVHALILNMRFKTWESFLFLFLFVVRQQCGGPSVLARNCSEFNSLLLTSDLCPANPREFLDRYHLVTAYRSMDYVQRYASSVRAFVCLPTFLLPNLRVPMPQPQAILTSRFSANRTPQMFEVILRVIVVRIQRLRKSAQATFEVQRHWFFLM